MLWGAVDIQKTANRIPTNKSDWKLDWVWRNICPSLRCGFNWILGKITNLQHFLTVLIHSLWVTRLLLWKPRYEYYFGIKVYALVVYLRAQLVSASSLTWNICILVGGYGGGGTEARAPTRKIFLNRPNTLNLPR